METNTIKTLIIHPEDESTLFLENIYKNIDNKTVITKDKTKHEIIDLINEHDKVIMLGHGSPDGLFSVGKFPSYNGYIIDYSMVNVLNKKQNNIFIWCYASSFVKKNKLKGFASGMFISEIEEADFCGVYGVDKSIINESNESFVNELSRIIDKPVDLIYNEIKDKYGKLSEINPVALYNNNRLFVS